VVGGGTSVLTAAAQSHGGNNQYNIGGPVAGVGQSLAQTALEHDYNIPTTGHRSQARTLLVYVNQYIDLSDWYDLTLRVGR
jgi:type IV secretory pathway VirB10-like protein